jgi:UDP-2-acetamido-3-amino-2,3-dideoxy-glucuronate N-acetyltransferase
MATGTLEIQPDFLVPERCIAAAVFGRDRFGLAGRLGTIGSLRSVTCDVPGLPDVLERAFPGIVRHRDLESILSDSGCVAVALDAPAPRLAELAMQCLSSGKSLYLTDPFALSRHQADALVLAAADARLHLMLGAPEPCGPAGNALTELLCTSDLGRLDNLLSIRSGSCAQGPARSLLGADLCLLLELAGEHVGTSAGQSGFSGSVAVSLTFVSGLNGHLLQAPRGPEEHRVTVCAERGTAVLDLQAPAGRALALYTGAGHADNLPLPRGDAENDPCAVFVDAVRQGQNGCRAHPCLHEALDLLDSLEGPGFDDEPHPAPAASSPPYQAHESAVVEPGARIGRGTRIWHFSHILAKARIGRNCNLGQNVMVGPDAVVGDGCKIQNNVSVYPGVTLEDDVFCGPSMVFTNVHNPRAHIPRMHEMRRTRVCKGATLGANCTILCGVNIGPYAFVGAGAVVLEDVPAHTLVVGNPAKPEGYVCSCATRLDRDLHCPSCKKSYRKYGAGLTSCTSETP